MSSDATQNGARSKRKWDSSDPGQASAAALQGAASAAAAINMRLAALAPPAPLVEAVDLCSAPAAARVLLSKRATLDALVRPSSFALPYFLTTLYQAQATGCSLSIKGVFVLPGATLPTGERALHILIAPGSALAAAPEAERRAALARGVAAVRERLSGQPPLSAAGPPPPLRLAVGLSGAEEDVAFGAPRSVSGFLEQCFASWWCPGQQVSCLTRARQAFSLAYRGLAVLSWRTLQPHPALRWRSVAGAAACSRKSPLRSTSLLLRLMRNRKLPPLCGGKPPLDSGCSAVQLSDSWLALPLPRLQPSGHCHK